MSFKVIKPKVIIVRLINIHLQCMTKGKQATIQTLLLVEYSNILLNARRGVKGLRLPHLFSIQLLGQYGELGLSEAGRLTKRSPQCIQNRFDRVIMAGFICKSGKKYCLSESGRQVYNELCASFATSMEKIVRALVEEARSRL